MEKPSDTPVFINNELLNDIRRNADWQATFLALGLQKDAKASRDDDWWCSSPFALDEGTASFHMNADPKGGGRWHCFSTGKGGGLPDLVQRMHGGNIYEAGRWLLDHGCSYLREDGEGSASPAPASKATGAPCASLGALGLDDEGESLNGAVRSSEGGQNSGEKKKKGVGVVNKPVRQSLLSALVEKGTHAEFERRGVSEVTCDYLGCGYLPETHKSSLRGRVVFQVRGLDDLEAVKPKRTILTHIGRATTPEQAVEYGKWIYYKGFHKSLELYNIDQLRLDPEAAKQISDTGNLILVEGCFDVAACIEGGIRNVVASLGTQVSETQMDKLHKLKEVLQIKKLLVWFDRDQAGQKAQEKLVAELQAQGIAASGFDWGRRLESPIRGDVYLPEELSDPGDFSAEQVKWLRGSGEI